MTEKPTGPPRGGPERTTNTTTARQERIRRALAERGLGRAGDAAGSGPFPRPGAGPHPLSSAQRRMWFAQQRDPRSAAYNICVGFRIEGELDPARLRRAFEAVVAHQDVLRTVYPTDAEGLPVQRVRAAAEPGWEVVDCTTDPDEVDRLARRAGRRPFDLARDCPLRLTLARTGARDHVLVMVVHHIAVDDLSWAPLLREVAAHYRADGAVELADGFPQPVTYAGFAAWERERLSSGHHDESLAYWRQRLDPWPAPVALPAGGGAHDAGEDGLRRRTVLPTETGEGLLRLAKESNSSLFMTTLACVTAVLGRYGDSQDVAVGTVSVNRPRPELDPLVGNFGNTVLLRCDVDRNRRFHEHLADVRQVCIEAFGQQDVPFDHVVETIRPPRQRDGSGLFNVMFTQRGQTLPEDIDFPGQTWSDHPVFNGSTRFDLAVEVLRGPDGVVLTATGARTRFDAEALDRVLGHLRTLLEAAVAAPATRLGDLPLMPRPEYDRVVHEWNATDRPEYHPWTTLPGLFRERARRSPDAPAVVSGDRVLTYGELDARSDQLAGHLVARGVRPRDLVGVLLERSPELVVAMLGALKAGGAFVPLDPAWPALRREELVAESGLAACVTTGALLESGALAAVAPDAVHVDLLADADVIAARAPRPPEVEVALDDVAYVIHTSGSTGVPKGAMITHQGIVNRLPWQADLLGLSETDAVLHKAPVSFDISVNEIFLPLTAGCRLVLADAGAEGDVAYLLSVIAEHRVTFVYLVSSLLDLMVDRDDAAPAFGSLRHVWCGGEVLTPELYERFRQRCDARMYHGYGPAEATIGVTCRIYESLDQVRDITIGRPNPNSRVHLLDRDRQPVPVGALGEIHIGGLPLAAGYLGDPVRTAERFVPDPFRPGERLYRTGDLARYRPDGEIEFVGRTDNQVKINGRRVELEEIEAKLASHPRVRQAVVLMRGRARQSRRPTAFVTAAEGGVEPDRLRDWLADRLPSFMVPATVLVLPELPLKSSGKVDKEALATVRLPQTERSVPYAAPRGALQRTLADIWARTLGLERVGAEENFFDLGGHSLLVVRVQTEIRRELGRDIPVVALFENPTIASVAAHLDRETDGAAAGVGEEARDLERVRRRASRQLRVRAARGRTAVAKETP